MKRLVLVGAAFAAFCMVASDASAKVLYSQSNILRNEDLSGGVPCGGTATGTCKITEDGAIGNAPNQSDNIKIQCNLKGAAPGNYTVYWTGTSTARGCHNQATGFVVLGNVAVPGTGKAKFTATQGNNPFPGAYVHLDLLGPDVLTSVYAGIPIGVGPAAAGAQDGDPTGH